MTSRERIERTFRFEATDRVACFEQLIYSSVASELMGRPMHTGGGPLERAYAEAWLEGGAEACRQLADRVFQDVVALHRQFPYDMVRPVTEGGPRPTRKANATTYLVKQADGSSVRYVFDEASQTMSLFADEPATVDQVRRQVEDLERTLDDYHPTADDYAIYRRHAEALPDVPICAPGVTMSIPMRSPWMELTLLEPDLVHRYIENCTQRILRRVPALREAGASIALGGGDLATSKGPVYSPDVFRRFMLPRFSRIVQACRAAGMPYVFRTDGWLWPFMDMIFGEMGCEGYGEIDGAAGMDLAEVRPRFPRLTLWGNVPCGTLLLHGSPRQVEDYCRRCVAQTGGGRGLILGSSNCLVHGTPAANVLAMFRALERG